MSLSNKLTAAVFMLASAATLQARIASPQVVADFESRKPDIDSDILEQICSPALPDSTAQCLQVLYAYMPLPDMLDRTPQYYMDHVVTPALKARKEMPWGKNIPDEVFRHYVLPIRVNNEALDLHRPIFYEELKKRIQRLDMTSAILEINHWCHEKVTYQPSDGRTHSPLQSVSSAIGRCGEESTFTVAAMRAMGIPARQVYTPRWAHTDDNHAWVEVWADGEWHFLGACEPEPVLDLGWFNAPAARGMLMHARTFGNYYGTDEVLGRQPGNTDINVTSHYAPTDTLYICVTDRTGQAVPDAKVTFRIYNYAEFYPIAAKLTDANGETSLIAGLGDILVWATDGNRFGLHKCTVGRDKRVYIPLIHDGSSELDFTLDIVPPAQQTISVPVTDEMRAANDRRLAREDSIRNSYMASWPKNISPTITKSRGNHEVITNFLATLPSGLEEKALSLLANLSEKDLTDVPLYVLRDHINAREHGGDMFARYVMSPRIDMEELTPFREFFDSVITPAQMESFRDNPTSWVLWVADSITADREWYPSQVTMSPKAVWYHRHTSPKSRDIFFVAGARTMGIPARIDPVTQKTQWADSTGIWHDALFTKATPATAGTSVSPKCSLSLRYKPSANIPDPKYYTHFTLSGITGGEPSLLSYPDFIPWSETFRDGQAIDAGQYMLVTGQRLADGGVLATVRILNLKPDITTMTDTLTIRHDDSRIQVIGSFDSESKYLPATGGAHRSILSTTGRGYYILGLLKPNHEPSNHALRDIAAMSRELEAAGRPIVLLYESPEDLSKAGLESFPAMPSTVTFGSDIDGDIAGKITEALNLSDPGLPVIIIADTFNRVVFLSQGYTIGLGQTLTDILHRL